MKNLLIMHVHPSSPNSSISEENAATKIQANFRGYRVRKQIKDTSVVSASSCVATATNGAAASGCSAGQQSTDGGSILTSAVVGKRGAGAAVMMGDERDQSATKIQAGIRGFLVRKKQKMASDAATKIQANFRGFKTRQDLKRMN